MFKSVGNVKAQRISIADLVMDELQHIPGIRSAPKEMEVVIKRLIGKEQCNFQRRNGAIVVEWRIVNVTVNCQSRCGAIPVQFWQRVPAIF